MKQLYIIDDISRTVFRTVSENSYTNRSGKTRVLFQVEYKKLNAKMPEKQNP